MTSFQNILCPIDFSRPAGRALRYAGALAKQSGARLTVLFVNDPLLEIAGASAYDARAIRKSTEEDLRRFVQSAAGASRTRRRSATQLMVAVGDPAEEIQKVARRLKDVCVVMGTHGLSGVRKVLFGSTTEKYLRLTTKPVLLIPPARR
jgi:nucleotide-binding universal stress UspA family protein